MGISMPNPAFALDAVHPLICNLVADLTYKGAKAVAEEEREVGRIIQSQPDRIGISAYQ